MASRYSALGKNLPAKTETDSTASPPKPNKKRNRKPRARRRNKKGNSNSGDRRPTVKEQFNPVDETVSKRQGAKWQKEMYCSWFQQGYCARGDKCFYKHKLDPSISHPEPPPAKTSTKTPNVKVMIETPDKPRRTRRSRPRKATQNKWGESFQNPHSQKPPSNGYPPNMPPQGYPPSGYPPSGYPPSGYPPSGYPSYSPNFYPPDYPNQYPPRPHPSYPPPYPQMYPYPPTGRPAYNPQYPPPMMSPPRSTDFDFGAEEDAKNLSDFFQDVPDDILFEMMLAEDEAEQADPQLPISMRRFDEQQTYQNTPGAVYSYHLSPTQRSHSDSYHEEAKQQPLRPPRSQSGIDYSNVASRHRSHATRLGPDGIRRPIRGHGQTISQDPDAWDPSKKICPFFTKGNCMYGERCRDAHRFESDTCPNCNARVGFDVFAQQFHMEECSAVSNETIVAEKTASKELACGICHENITKLDRRFGLLTDCNHPFCLECIRQWRGVLLQSKEAVRGCPICRQPSWFIVPCDRMVTDPDRKKKLIEEYQANLANIRCRHFDETEECPFGTSCFYKHVKKDGTVEVPKKLRHVVDGDGNVKIVRDYSLRDHLFGPTG